VNDGEARIVATFSIKNKHSLTVEIRYSGQQFSVVYQDSSNLNYAQGPNGLSSTRPTTSRSVDWSPPSMRVCEE